MKKIIYSKVDGKVLHMVNFLDNKDLNRFDIVPEENFIQCAFLRMNKGKTFKPHKHIIKSRSFDNMIAQESWIVIKGKVKCIFYDINDKIIETIVLNPGDASFTLRGGHNYEILEEDTIVYEYKTGPYEGQINDKEFINE